MAMHVCLALGAAPENGKTILETVCWLNGKKHPSPSSLNSQGQGLAGLVLSKRRVGCKGKNRKWQTYKERA